MQVKISNISKKYGAQDVLSAVNMVVSGPQIVGLVGRNGAGKTTLLKILAGILKPDFGTIQIQDNSKRPQLSYMSERNPLYENMHVAEYLEWIAKSNNLEDISNQVKIKLKELGLVEVQGKKISELSKGFKQRVGIAAALIGDPIVTLLDEPINGLDPSQILEIRSLLKGLSKDRIIVLSSHLLQEIEALCDQVLIIEDTSVSKVGSKDSSILYQMVLDKEIDISIIDSIQGVSAFKLSNYVYQLTIIKNGEATLDVIFDNVVAQGARIRKLGPVGQELDKLFIQK